MAEYVIYTIDWNNRGFIMTKSEINDYIDANTIEGDNIEIKDDGTIIILNNSKVVFVGNSRNINVERK